MCRWISDASVKVQRGGVPFSNLTFVGFFHAVSSVTLQLCGVESESFSIFTTGAAH